MKLYNYNIISEMLDFWFAFWDVPSFYILIWGEVHLLISAYYLLYIYQMQGTDLNILRIFLI